MQRVRRAFDVLLLVAGALTAVLIFRTFWYLTHSLTNVPYTDQWIFLDEIRRFQAGTLDVSYFWSSYWGQRNLVPRILFLLTAKYFSFASWPLILLNVLAEVSMLLVLVRAARRLLPGSRHLFLAAAIAFAHLVFSSLAMEVLVIPQNVQHTIGYASAVAAILLFDGRRLWTGITLGALATGCMAIGLLVWPILLIEAWYARAGRRTMAILAATSAIVILCYLTGYTRPAMGMGIGGAILHPLQTIAMTGLVLGGPITLYSLRLGTIAGCIGLAAAAWFAARYLRPSSKDTAAIGLVLTAGFLTVCAFTIAVGRISPEWLASLHGAQPLPSRYIAPTLVFWGCLFALALASKSRPAIAVVAIIVLAITFGTWSWQWRVSREWAVAMQKFDATASGFLANVEDPELMPPLLTDSPLRTSLVNYMRTAHLSVFAEPRANWIGRRLSDLGFQTSAATCQSDRSATPLPSPNTFRVTGTITPAQPLLDLLFTDDAGTVIGIARSLPAQSESRPAADFLGYARTASPAAIHLYALLPDGSICSAPPVPH